MAWRLYDLFLAKGYWFKEFTSEKKKSASEEIQEQKRKLEELDNILKEETE
jgi:hypothetical protein